MFIINEYSGGASLNFLDNLTETYKLLINSEDYFLIEKQLSSYAPHLVGSLIRRVQFENKIPILLGGDHSITYYGIKEIYSKTKDFVVIHFDAHHDSFKESLNHYSVFHHIKQNFNLNIVGVGYRQGTEVTPSILEKDIYEDVYISIDADYFSPLYIPSVNHPIKTGNPKLYSLNSFQRSLDHIKGKILCLDFVEWRGADLYSKEFLFVKNIIKIIQSKSSNGA